MFGQRTTGFTAWVCEGCPKLVKREQLCNGAGISLAVAWVVQACEKCFFSVGQGKHLPSK